MTARKRAQSATTGAAVRPPSTDTQRHKSEPATSSTSSTDPPIIAPSKAGQILKFSLIFFVPYFYLICYHYRIENELKKSILINASLSFVGFFLTLTMIPVASKYVLRRNLFGFDINKKGTPQGSIKV